MHLFAFFLHRIVCSLNLHRPPPPGVSGLGIVSQNNVSITAGADATFRNYGANW